MTSLCTRRSWGIVFCLSAALLAPARARAQDVSSLIGEKEKEAEQYFEQGKVLYGEKAYAAALEKFEQACAMHRTVNCTKNLGFAEFRLRRYADATGHLREFFRAASAAPSSVSQNVLTTVRKVYEDSYAQCGHLRITAPAGAEIRVGTRLIGRAPIADIVDIEVGTHVIAAHTAHGVLRVPVQMTAGYILPVEFTAPKVLKQQQPDLVAQGDKGESASAAVQENVRRVEGSTATSSPAKTYTVVTLYSLAALGLAAGGLLMFDAGLQSDNAASRRSELADQENGCTGVTSPTCDRLSSLKDRYDSDRKWATVSFVGAGALALAATAALAFWPSSDGTRSARIVPIVTPSGGGLGYVTSF